MAAKFGYEAIKYLVKKNMMKRGTGITTIPGKSQKLAVAANTDALHKLMQAKGIDTAKVSVKDVEKFVNIQNAINKKLKSRVISQGDPEFQGITEKLLGKNAQVHPFTGFKPRVQQDVDSIIKNLKSMEPTVAMKEANLVIGRKGNYKHLSNDEAQRILKETDDHIFQRDIKYDEFGDPIKPDPEDMASGGVAGQLHLNRPGYKSGLLVKLAKLFKKKPKPKSNRLSELDVANLKKKHGLDPESLKKDEEAFKLRLQQILAKHSTKHAEGGRASYTKGGLAKILGV